LTFGNVAAFIPLKLVAPDRWKSIVNLFKSQDAKRHLPSTYTTQQVRGYEKQRALLVDSMKREDNAVLELPVGGSPGTTVMLTKPIDRGTILLNPADRYAEPIVDYNTFNNPVDVLIHSENFRWTRRFLTSTPSVKPLEWVETAPGTNVTSDKALEEALRATTFSSNAHQSCTNAMMPRELGGVVDPLLRVYGVTGVTVADSSIMPLIPGAHLCATVYAIAEKVSVNPFPFARIGNDC